MRQTCVTNARRPCGLPRVRVAGLCCRAEWSGWDAGLVGCAGPLHVSLGGGPPARLPHVSLRLGVVYLEARPGLAATRRHRGWALQTTRCSGSEWFISRLAWPCCRPPPPRLGPASHAVQRLGVVDLEAGLALLPPAATAPGPCRPRGTAARPRDRLLGAQGACKPRGAPVAGGVGVLDRKLSSG